MNILKKIIDTLKDYIGVYDDDLSFLDVGDIVLARRYQTDDEKNKIKEGHRESPFVIISKEKGKTIALQCTSNPHINIKWKNILYPLNRLTYNLNKNCYVNTTYVTELKNIQYIKKLNHLKSYDMNKIFKSLYIVMNSKFKYKPKFQLKKIKFNYEVGDIILYDNQKYYIDKIDNKNYLTFKVNNKNKIKNRILINNTYYSFSFNNVVVIKRKSKIDLVETFNTSEIELINNLKKEILNKKVSNNKRIVKIGALIDYNSNYYYIIDEDETNFIAIRIHTSRDKDDNMILVNIDDGNYYTYFNDIRLAKKDYKIRRYATNNEVNYIKKLSELTKKNRQKLSKKVSTKNNSERKDIKYFVPKTIIVNKKNNNYYLILSRNDNTLELVNINDLSDYFYYILGEDSGPYEYYRIISEEEFLKYNKKINELQELAKLLVKK